jgi:gliding motility-associated-like protein
MKKALPIIAALLLTAFGCSAHHIVGGEMLYQYLGKGAYANTSKYLITLKIFRDQNAGGAPMPSEVNIGIFSKDDGSAIFKKVQRSKELTVPEGALPPCTNIAPNLNYHVGIFELTIELPDNANGYTATYQTCCRIDNMGNVENNGGAETGSTFTTDIPSYQYKDNSPEFATIIDVVCSSKPFRLNYSATDKDNDSLVYSFTPAYDNGNKKYDALYNPDPPPYHSVKYFLPGTYNAPLGPESSIDPKTGIVTGTAPSPGKYVLAVKVSSFRKGVLINEHRKDFIINVTSCAFAGAELDPLRVCDDFKVTFNNVYGSSMNKTYNWNFGDPNSGINNTSYLKNPTHVFTDTGAFVCKLVVNRGMACSDSTVQTLNVYPGFFPSFSYDGNCINAITTFTDETSTKYGTVDSWKWNFGDTSILSDTSIEKNPSYVYNQKGNYDVKLTVGSDKGCLKSITKTVPVTTPFDFSINNDTLICNIDTIQLTASGRGNIAWTPSYNISDTSSFTPLVSPKVPITYFATLKYNGCIAKDSVMVNVVSKVSLSLKSDTSICLTDTLQLKPLSDGLHYIWTPANTILNDTAKYACAVPDQNTTYHVISRIGSCTASANIKVRTIPYPQAIANDTTICFPDNGAQLHASGGSIYKWTPTNFLSNPNIPDPVASPTESMTYLLQVNDVLGCPKPAYAHVTVAVEKLLADAGPADTSIIVDQPLQLNGMGGQFYSWSPPGGLNDPNIADPVALLNESQKYTLTVRSAAGCSAEDSIHVTVYKVLPDFYVPDAFTPNGDGINDIFRPIPIGIKQLNYFKIYNRLGQLVYSTAVQKQGWDGTMKGEPQPGGVYVWIAEGVDYLGKKLVRKGSVTLIR